MSILESFLAGKEARRVADAAAQVNAMTAFIGQNGAAIMGGDQNALGRLAGFGPQGLQMAMGIQGDVQSRERQARLDAQAMDDRQYTRARQEKQDARADAEWEMQLTEYKKTISAEQAAAEAAQAEEAAKMALTAKSPEEWDMLAQKNGAPELVGMFDQREAVAARFMSVAEVLKAQQPPDPADRYKVVGQSLFDLQAEGGPAAVGQGAMQETMVMGPDGKPIMVQGGPGTTAKFTEAQSKDNVFATRAAGALEKLETPVDPNNPESPTVADSLSSLQDNLASGIPVIGNYLTGEGYQVAETAGQEFLQAILRKDTGAAITAQEQDLYGKTYLPQPGDSADRLKYKREARQRALEAIKAGMNVQQLEAMARADAAVLNEGAPARAKPTGPTVVDGYTIEAIE